MNTLLALVNRKAFDFDRTDERQENIARAVDKNIARQFRLTKYHHGDPIARRKPIGAAVSRSLRRYGERKYERTKHNGRSYKLMQHACVPAPEPEHGGHCPPARSHGVLPFSRLRGNGFRPTTIGTERHVADTG